MGEQLGEVEELRLVHTSDGGLRAGWFVPGENRVKRYFLLGHSLAFFWAIVGIGLAGMSTTLGASGGWMFLVSCLPPMLTFLFLPLLLQTTYRMMTIDARGLTLSIVSISGLMAPQQMGVDALQDPELHRSRLGKSATQRLAYVDLVDMGHSDFSLWFEDEGGARTELRLDWLPRQEVERLFSKIHPSWQRARAALMDDLEDARRAAEQLRALAPQ